MRVADNQACIGCPLRGDGSQQFVGDTIKPGAPVYLQADQAGDTDPVQRNKRYIELAGLTPEQVSAGHAIRCTADLPKPVLPAQFAAGKRGVLENAVRFCDRVHSRWSGHQPGSVVEHNQVGPRPRLVVTQGDLALYAASGQRSAHEWRGWVTPYRPVSDSWLSEVWTPGPTDLCVLATVSMPDLRAMPTLQYGMRADWAKAGRILRGEWPQPWPGYEDRPPKAWPRLSAFDTEFPDGVFTRYSLYDGGRMPWVIEAERVQQVEIPQGVTVVMHNIEADLQYLTGILRGGSIKTEDTMLMHAALWSDLQHTLEWLGSIHARINRWKHLFHRNPKVYSGGDAIGTWDVYVALVNEFRQDPGSARVYREELFPLTPIIMEAETVGLRLNQDRVNLALETHEALRQEVCNEAMAYAGYPLLLSSADQVQRHLYELENVGVKQRRKHG